MRTLAEARIFSWVQDQLLVSPCGLSLHYIHLITLQGPVIWHHIYFINYIPYIIIKIGPSFKEFIFIKHTHMIINKACHNLNGSFWYSWLMGHCFQNNQPKSKYFTLWKSRICCALALANFRFCQSSGPMVQHYCHGITFSIHQKPV